MFKTIRNAACSLWWGLAFSAGAVYAEDQDLSNGVAYPLKQGDAVIISAATRHWLAQIEQPRRRLLQEAIALFPAVLNGKIKTLDRCQIFSAWLSSSEIDEWDAKKYLGVKAHANLSAPYHGTDPANVLDPQGLYAKLFCDSVETAADDKQRFLEFEKAFASDKSARLTTAQLSFSFPVFNEGYSRAAIVIQDEGRHWRDPSKVGDWGGEEWIEIYEKRNGIWKLLAKSDRNSWDGTARRPI
jgi:hypothetical protein